MESQDSSQWITIGEFARLGGVSIKALRIYAEIGLLPPAAIRPQSRYRLYSRAQLTTLHRILMLKNAGFPLAQIGSQLAHRDEAALSKIHASLISRAEEIRRQLAWIEAEMRAARNRAHAVAPVVIKRSPEMRILSRRSKMDSYDQADGMIRDLGSHAPDAARLVPGAIWHDCGQNTRVIDCEVFWMLKHRLRAGAVKTLPAATVASVLHDGDESAIGGTYEAVRRWISDSRHRVIGPNREIYHSTSLVEIQFPIARQ
jgi:DNA-binding transcriptional MerR regulator